MSIVFRRLVLLPTFVVAAMVCSACGWLAGSSKADAISQMKWSYSDNGVELTWCAHPDLNSYNGEKHALSLVVVQVSDPNVFKQLIASSAALTFLLTAQTVPTGTVDFQRLFVQPGEIRTVKLARASNAQYVGIVAGYYDMKPETSARLYPIDVDVRSHGWIVKAYEATPAPLKVSLELGKAALIVNAEKNGYCSADKMRGDGR